MWIAGINHGGFPWRAILLLSWLPPCSTWRVPCFGFISYCSGAAVYLGDTVWPDRENGKLSIQTELPFPLSQHPVSVSRNPHTHKGSDIDTDNLLNEPKAPILQLHVQQGIEILFSCLHIRHLVHCCTFRTVNKLVSTLFSFLMLWFIICQWIEFLRVFCISGSDYWSMRILQDPQINALWTVALKLAILNPGDKIYQNIQKELWSKARGAWVEVCYFILNSYRGGTKPAYSDGPLPAFAVVLNRTRLSFDVRIKQLPASYGLSLRWLFHLQKHACSLFVVAVNAPNPKTFITCNNKVAQNGKMLMLSLCVFIPSPFQLAVWRSESLPCCQQCC